MTASFCAELYVHLNWLQIAVVRDLAVRCLGHLKK